MKRLLLMGAVMLLSACATPPQDEARALAREGRGADALAVLDRALAGRHRGDVALRAERERLQQSLVQQGLALAERARAAGRTAEARGHLQRVLALAPGQERALALAAELERTERLDLLVQQLRNELRPGASAEVNAAARERLQAALREQPGHVGARTLLAQLQAAAAPAAAVSELPPALAATLRRPVTLEFREAPLRQVFEALSRSHGLNFVFDRDVRADTRVSLALRDIALDEALRVLLVTQQLDRKWLNAGTIFVFPATVAKQREHTELVTRTLYLVNAEAKAVAPLVRTLAKTQDVHVDERINALVVRDAPAVVRLVEDLVASIDLPEAEVMIDVEVLEVSSARLAEIGLQWPEQVSIGEFDALGNALDTLRLTRGMEPRLQARTSNPLLLASLRASDGDTQTLANPTIRARNREKAQVHVGEKLPVFTTTSTANVGVSASVSYLDVGIKLDVEPTVQLDNDVTIKVTLEVSNLLRQVSGPGGSIGYQLGTRRTSTTLRLADGETQILAGLTKDDELKSVNGVPGLARAPWVGRLFGINSDQRNKTEVVLLMTPRIVRNLPLPEARLTLRPGGTAANPGAEPLRLAERAVAGVRPSSSPGSAAAAPATAAGTAPAQAAPLLELQASTAVAAPGQKASVTLRNPSEYRISGEFVFDPALLANAAANAAPDQRSQPFDLPPGASVALVLRVLPAAAGSGAEVSVNVTAALGADGLPARERTTVAGSGRIEVRDGAR
jgi:general secretion pathway protein D